MNKSKKDISSFLSGSISKNKVLLLSDEAKRNAQIYELLWQLITDRIQPISWRAIWALDHATQHNPEILKPRLSDMYKLLSTETHSGMKRQLLNLVLRYPVKLHDAEIILDTILVWLQNPKEAIAVRANAVKFLFEVCKLEPDLKHELLEVLNQQLYQASSGLANTIQKTIARLHQPQHKWVISSKRQD